MYSQIWWHLMMIVLEMCTGMAFHFLSLSLSFRCISFMPSLSLSMNTWCISLTLSLHKLVYVGIYCALQRHCTDYEEGCGYYIRANLLLLGKGSSLVCYIISNGLCDLLPTHLNSEQLVTDHLLLSLAY